MDTINIKTKTKLKSVISYIIKEPSNNVIENTDVGPIMTVQFGSGNLRSERRDETRSMNVNSVKTRIFQLCRPF